MRPHIILIANQFVRVNKAYTSMPKKGISQVYSCLLEWPCFAAIVSVSHIPFKKSDYAGSRDVDGNYGMSASVWNISHIPKTFID